MNDFKPIAPALVALAERWEVYPSSFDMVSATVVDGEIVKTVTVTECERCKACDVALVPPADPQRVLRHLLAFHGYRMDGRQFDNANNLIGSAADAQE